MPGELDLGAAVAYFSMEVALADDVPTYSGGLGVLAGDHVRSAADLGIPLVGVTLLYHHGYFAQHVDAAGQQHESPVQWDPTAHLERVPIHVTVPIAGRRVRVGAWRYVVTGVGGHEVPVYLLDTKVPGNSPEDQSLTDALYGGDEVTRIGQELILGVGGVCLLAALGHRVTTYHLNEGHSAFLALALLDQVGGADGDRSAWDQVCRQCVFTTHTPVAAGHDRFGRDLVTAVLEPRWTDALERRGLLAGGTLNMTELALASARQANAVSLRHAEVTRQLFPVSAVDAVTNGVHAATWAVPAVADLLDRHVPQWRVDNAALRYASGIPLHDVRAAHRVAKEAMVAAVADRTGVALDPAALTLGVARRATAYKRTSLVLSRPERLRAVVAAHGPLQLVFAGKAHPRDEAGKALIRAVVAASADLRDDVTVVFVEGYSMALGRLLAGGVDVWCNTPVRPHEASGTSGMKAAINGVPSLSVLDGWWIEGHVEGVTGWSIGAEPDVAGTESGDPDSDPTYVADAESFADKLEHVVAPLYYEDPDGFAAVQRGAMALNGSFFTTERMVREYASCAYDLRPLPWATGAEASAGVGA